ncbi:MAG: aminotransferase class IV [Bacteroidetes bacterium]|nr:aminotransferase class IV [Bacteroidota bacterium]
MQEEFCIYNGHLVSIYEPSVSFSNRAFRYGDSLFESMHFTNGKIMFIADHIKRLKLGMTVMRMNVPAEFNAENIHHLAQHLASQNKIQGDARIRLTVFRNDGGFYTPEVNDISFLIETERIETKGYTLNQKGLWVDLYAEIRKPLNKLSGLKTGSAMLYVMAGLSKLSMKLDDCLLVNETGNICEAISSNLFIVKNGSMYTSPLSEGCVDGIMRKQILQLAAQNKILVFETPITVNTIMNGDEMFLTNAVNGIQWVGQFKNKFYTNRMAVFFTEKLNELSQ